MSEGKGICELYQVLGHRVQVDAKREKTKYIQCTPCQRLGHGQNECTAVFVLEIKEVEFFLQVEVLSVALIFKRFLSV